MECIHSQDTPILAIICELVGPLMRFSPQGSLLPVDDYGRFRIPAIRDVVRVVKPAYCLVFQRTSRKDRGNGAMVISTEVL